MKSLRLSSPLLLLLLLAPAWAQAAAVNYILETSDKADLGGLGSRYQFTVVRSWQDSSHFAHLISVPAPFPAAQAAALLKEPGVLEIESDAEVRAGTENPPLGVVEPLTEQLLPRPSVQFFGAKVRASYVDQPAMRLIGLAEAQRRYPAGNAVVAIVDTGVDEKHPALQGVLLPGYDFTRDRPGTASEYADLDQSTVAILDQSTVAILDGKHTPVRLNQSTVAILDQSTVAILDGRLPKAFGHGTMVAGVVHLVAPAARILPLKAFHADGTASLSNIIRAIYYAVERKADIINLSFSFTSSSPELARAVAFAQQQGLLVVASAGNDAKKCTVYPAGLRRVFGVASTNYSDRRSSFTNYGEGVGLSAPGEAVITTFPGNNYAGVWGTSFSTPMIAGALAIMHQINPDLKYSSAREALEQGVELPGDLGKRLVLPAALRSCSRSH